jgi:hypothetical protein
MKVGGELEDAVAAESKSRTNQRHHWHGAATRSAEVLAGSLFRLAEG